MPPQIALIFVLAFIIFVTYIEHRNSKISGGPVWIIAIWLLYSSSKGLGIFFNVETTIEQGSLPDRYFLFILGAMAAIILIKRKFPLITVLKQNRVIILIIMYMLISAAWSQHPGISFRRWGREALALIFTLLLTSEENPIKTLISALKKSIYAALPLSILLIKYYPAYGREYGRWTGEVMWTGIASQKNGLAMLCAISILFLFWNILESWKKERQSASIISVIVDLVMIILAAYFMMGPQHTLNYSATSFLSLVVGLLIFVTLKYTLRKGSTIKKLILITAMIIISIGISMPFSGKLPLKTIPKLLNRSETLTQRTEIWGALIPYAKKHLLLGYGYGSFWTTELRGQIASHAHNGYLDTILDLGLSGLILFISFIFLALIKSIESLKINFNPSSFFISLIFMIILRCIAESPLGEFQTFHMWLILSWYLIINAKYKTKHFNEEK